MLRTKVNLKSAKIVAIGPGTKFPGNNEEQWETGYGVQLMTGVGIFIGTTIVPFAQFPHAEGFLKVIQEEANAVR